VNWVGAMLHWVKNFSNFGYCDKPCLAIQGSIDATVDANYNLNRIAEQFSEFEVQYIEGAMHHLCREAEHWQSQCFEALREFLAREHSE
jgi:alpha-beta hydrolase superfamily lysophospholipase